MLPAMDTHAPIPSDTPRAKMGVSGYEQPGRQNVVLKARQSGGSAKLAQAFLCVVL
jgi:hypothetical protein